MPNNARPTSVRRAPTRPARPRTSPARNVKDTPANTPSRARPRTSSTTSPGRPARGAADVETPAEPAENRLGVAAHGPAVDDPPAVPVTDEDVLGDREVGEDHRLLVHGRDPKGLRLQRTPHPHLASVDEDLAAVGLHDARHDLDERRLTGPVLSEKRVDLARLERQGNVVERLGGSEPLRDSPYLQDRRSRRRVGF